MHALYIFMRKLADDYIQVAKLADDRSILSSRGVASIIKAMCMHAWIGVGGDRGGVCACGHAVSEPELCPVRIRNRLKGTQCK
jgi:hypothetical protein